MSICVSSHPNVFIFPMFYMIKRHFHVATFIADMNRCATYDFSSRATRGGLLEMITRNVWPAIRGILNRAFCAIQAMACLRKISSL